MHTLACASTGVVTPSLIIHLNDSHQPRSTTDHRPQPSMVPIQVASPRVWGPRSPLSRACLHPRHICLLSRAAEKGQTTPFYIRTSYMSRYAPIVSCFVCPQSTAVRLTFNIKKRLSATSPCYSLFVRRWSIP